MAKITQQEYENALQLLLYYEGKAEQYKAITRAYLYAIEAEKLQASIDSATVRNPGPDQSKSSEYPELTV